MIAGAGKSNRFLARVRAALVGLFARKPRRRMVDLPAPRPEQEEQPAALTKRERRQARRSALAMTWSRRSIQHPLATLRQDFDKRRGVQDRPPPHLRYVGIVGWKSAKKREAARRAGLITRAVRS